MDRIYSSIACNLDDTILRASLPLFDSGKVQALEWAFDSLYQQQEIPDWFTELIRTFSDANRLIGHGVFFSLFSGCWSADQTSWLNHLTGLADRFHFDHITEHFGFMTGRNFHQGAPLGVPLTSATLTIGQDRLHRIQQAVNCPVGLENLAFAYSLDDVMRQGDFLHRLITPINGFIILDLHNLYCQAMNFNVSLNDLLRAYPLDRVREIHISGGSWSPSSSNPERPIRRDTHDDAVPDEVFGWLADTMPHCSNLKYVVLEQLGSGLTTDNERRLFSDDFLKMDQLIQTENQILTTHPINPFKPPTSWPLDSTPFSDTVLLAQQRELASILETAVDYVQAHQMLLVSTLANSAWAVEKWDSAMLETAVAIAQKWQHGFDWQNN